LDPEVVGEFDITIVLTGLNDLKEAFTYTLHDVGTTSGNVGRDAEKGEVKKNWYGLCML
jgi:hypothetical protein